MLPLRLVFPLILIQAISRADCTTRAEKNTVKVSKSSSFRLFCFDNQTNSIFTQWLKNSVNLSVQKRINIEKLGFYNVLSIERVRQKDEGLYLCQNILTNTTITKIVVIVNEPWILKAVRPSVKVLVGEEARLQCKINTEKHKPEMGYILWFYKNRLLNTRTNRHTITTIEGKSTLTISNVYFSDGGVITCQGGRLHNLNESRDYIHLHVFKPSTNLVTTPLYLENFAGSTVQFLCKTNAIPPNVTWLIEETGMVVAFGEKLVLHNVSSRDSNQYRCVSQHIDKKSTSVVTLVVKDAGDRISVNTLEDSVIHIPLQSQCEERFSENTTVTVYKNNKAVRPGLRHKVVEVKKCFYLLVLDVKTIDSGYYHGVTTSNSNKETLQEVTYALEAYGSPYSVSNTVIQYNCTHFLVNFTLPPNTTFTPWNVVSVTLWQYEMFSFQTIKNLLAINTTNSYFIQAVENLCSTNKSLAVELVVVGKFGVSPPTVVVPTKREDHLEDNVGSLSSSKIDFFLSFDKASCIYGNFSSSNHYKKSSKLLEIFNNFSANKIDVNLNGVYSENAYSLQMDFSNKDFSTVVKDYQTIKRFMTREKILLLEITSKSTICSERNYSTIGDPKSKGFTIRQSKLPLALFFIIAAMPHLLFNF